MNHVEVTNISFHCILEPLPPLFKFQNVFCIIFLFDSDTIRFNASKAISILWFALGMASCLADH